MKTSNITYSRSQKIWSWVALIGIFVCGIMAGGVIWKNKQWISEFLVKSLPKILLRFTVKIRRK